MSNVLTEIVNLLTSGLASYGQGVGQSLSSTVEAMFIAETTVEGVTTQHLSTFGGIVVVFCALGLAVSLCVVLFRFLTSFGART